MLIKVFRRKLGFFLCRLNVELSTRFIYMYTIYTYIIKQNIRQPTLLSQIKINLHY